MTNKTLPHPSTDQALLKVAETVADVAMQRRSDLDLVALTCAHHDQVLLSLVEEIDTMRIANAQLYIRLRHLERCQALTG